ncbi:MAG: NAD-dependent epimerase/dehydratase family protein [Candidatus Acidiferrales bacterium]
MKALVTGGAGFIGSHLADALLARGYEVRVLDNLDRRVHSQGGAVNLDPAVEFVCGDVRDRGAVEKALDGVSAIFHEATYQSMLGEYEEFFDVNVRGTALLFDVIREQGTEIEKFVVASSQAVYGEGQYYCSVHGLVLPGARSQERLDGGDWNVRCPQCKAEVLPVLLREEHTHPTGEFGLSKYAQEVTALGLGRILKIPTVALRYSLVQGPRQRYYQATSGICRSFVRGLRSGSAPLLFEDGRQLRDYIHVSDVVAANLAVLDDPRADGQAFNVGSGRATAASEYARVLIQRSGSRMTPQILGIYRTGDVRNAVSSIAKLEILGWTVTKGIRQILDDYLAWVDAAPDPPDFLAPAMEALVRAGMIRGGVRSRAATAAV